MSAFSPDVNIFQFGHVLDGGNVWCYRERGAAETRSSEQYVSDLGGFKGRRR